jgi:RNA polymerase sigma-70 factor (ECF subfamily)
MLESERAQLEAHIPALRSFSQSLTRDPVEADDLVQDSLERAIAKWDLFEPGTNLQAWLFTICRRLFLNKVRQNANRGPTMEYEDQRCDRPSRATQEVSMHFEQVREAFDRLPMNDRVILSLITIEGLKYEEAAALLKVPVGTVRSRLSRARDKLRTEVDAQDAADDDSVFSQVG